MAEALTEAVSCDTWRLTAWRSSASRVLSALSVLTVCVRAMISLSLVCSLLWSAVVEACWS